MWIDPAKSIRDGLSIDLNPVCSHYLGLGRDRAKGEDFSLGFVWR